MNSFIFISIKLFISLIAISYYIQKNNNGFLDIKHMKCFSNTFQLLRTLLTVVMDDTFLFMKNVQSMIMKITKS
jgi:hypothetical protein